jgi:hypothetical protein
MKFTLKQNSYSNFSRIAPAVEPYERTLSRPLSRPLGRGRDYRCDVASAPDFRAATRLVPPPEREEPEPEKIAPEMPQLAYATTRLVPPPEPEEIKAEMSRGLLGSLFSWLRGGAPARKQLRLVETVPLGEKRFVAIIHAQGRKYLVGGGASGVALLTSLDEPASQHDSIAPLPASVGVAG